MPTTQHQLCYQAATFTARNWHNLKLTPYDERLWNGHAWGDGKCMFSCKTWWELMADLRINGKIITQGILKKQDLKMQTGFTGYITQYNRSICHSELPGTIKHRKFLHWQTADFILLMTRLNIVGELVNRLLPSPKWHNARVRNHVQLVLLRHHCHDITGFMFTSTSSLNYHTYIVLP